VAKAFKTRATLVDVSKAARLSISTISRILNDPEAAKLYAEGTRKRVAEVAEQLGYRPNRLARSNRSGRTNQVGIVIHFKEGENDPSYHTLDAITGAMEIFEPAGFDIVLIPLADVESPEGQQPRLFTETFIDGALVMANISKEHRTRIETALQGNIAWCDAEMRRKQMCIWRDEIAAGYMAVQNLRVRNGKVACIGRDNELARPAAFRLERIEGARKAAEKRQYSFEIFRMSSDDLERELFESLLSEGYDIVCSDYSYAFQALSLALRFGHLVGRDVNISCADEITFNRRFLPDLARASFRRGEMGRIGARMLLKRLGRGEGKKFTMKSVVQKPEWIDGVTAGWKTPAK